MINEIGLEKEVSAEEEDKEMEEDSRSDLLNAPQDSRNTLGLIKSILKNNEVVKEFKTFTIRENGGGWLRMPTLRKG